MEGTVIAPIASSPIDSCRGRGKHSPLSHRVRSLRVGEKKKSDLQINTVTLYFSPSDLNDKPTDHKETKKTSSG